MRHQKNWLAGSVGLAVLLLALFLTSRNSISINPEAMMAAVTNTATPPLNVFSRSKEAYLHLTSPVFGFISKIVNLQTPGPFLPKDILSVTNPEPASPTKNIENSLVNIFCSKKLDKIRKVVTGSGALITENLVLTNAHVAIWPLIADSNSAVSCLIRTGSPAKATHSVRVVFVSPNWIQKNGKLINSAYTESGQDDYAILKISPLINSRTNLSSYGLAPIQMEENVPEVGSPIKVAAYPANVLGVKGVDAALSSKTERLSVRNLNTFIGGSGTGLSYETDIIETSPSSIGQQGSSGGIIADENNHLIGLISTVTDSPSGGKFIHGLTIYSLNKALGYYSNGGLSKILLLGSNSLEETFNQSYRKPLTSLLTNTLGI